MPVGLEVLNRKLSTHISQEELQAFPGTFPQHSLRQNYISSGTCFEYLHILLPTQVLQATPGSSYGFISLPSYSKY